MADTAELMTEVPATLVDLVIGEMPELDEPMTRARGDAAILAGEELEVLAARYEGCAQRTASAVRGDTGDTLAERHRGVVECAHAQAAVLKDLGHQCHAAADAAAQTRHLIIVTAIALGVQLAYDALLFFQGGGAKALADRIAAEQTMRAAVAHLTRITAEQGAAAAARRAGLQAIARNAGKAAGVGALFAGGSGVVAQAWDVASGVRERFDPEALLELAAAGALGGTVGAEVGRRLAPKFLKWLTPAAEAGTFRLLSAHLGGTMLLGSAAGVAGGAASTVPSLIIHRDEYNSLGEMFGVVRDNAVAGFAGGFVEAAGAGIRVHTAGRNALRALDTPASDLGDSVMAPERPGSPQPGANNRVLPPENAGIPPTEGHRLPVDTDELGNSPADRGTDHPATDTPGRHRVAADFDSMRRTDDATVPRVSADDDVRPDPRPKPRTDTAESAETPPIRDAAAPARLDSPASRPSANGDNTGPLSPHAEKPQHNSPAAADRPSSTSPRSANTIRPPWSRPPEPDAVTNPPKGTAEESITSAPPDTAAPKAPDTDPRQPREGTGHTSRPIDAIAPPAAQTTEPHQLREGAGHTGRPVDTAAPPDPGRADSPETSDARTGRTASDNPHPGNNRADDDAAEDIESAVDGPEHRGPTEWAPSVEIRREIVSRVRALQKEGMQEVLADPARGRAVIEELGQRFATEDVALNIKGKRVDMPLSQLFPPDQIAYMRYSIERSIASGCVQFKIGESALSLMLRHPEQVQGAFAASYENEPPTYAASWLDPHYVMHAQDGYPRTGGQHAFLQAAVRFLDAGWETVDPVWRDIAAIKDERSAARNPILESIPPERRAELDLPAHFVDDDVAPIVPGDKSVLSAATNMTSVQQVMRGFLDSLGNHSETIAGTPWADIQHAVIQSPQKLSVMAGVTFTTLGEFTEPRRPPQFDIKFDEETKHITNITVTGEAKAARAENRPGFCPGFQSLQTTGNQAAATTTQMESVREVLDDTPNRSVSGSNTLMQVGSLLLPLLARDYPDLRLTAPTIIDRLIEQRRQNRDAP